MLRYPLIKRRILMITKRLTWSLVSIGLLGGCVTTSERIANLRNQNEMGLCVDYLAARFNNRVQDAQASEISKRNLNCAPYQEAARLKIEADRARSAAIDRSFSNLQQTLRNESERLERQTNERNRAINANRPIHCTTTRMGNTLSTQCF